MTCVSERDGRWLPDSLCDEVRPVSDQVCDDNPPCQNPVVVPQTWEVSHEEQGRGEEHIWRTGDWGKVGYSVSWDELGL